MCPPRDLFQTSRIACIKVGTLMPTSPISAPDPWRRLTVRQDRHACGKYPGQNLKTAWSLARHARLLYIAVHSCTGRKPDPPTSRAEVSWVQYLKVRSTCMKCNIPRSKSAAWDAGTCLESRDVRTTSVAFGMGRPRYIHTSTTLNWPHASLLLICKFSFSQ